MGAPAWFIDDWSKTLSGGGSGSARKEGMDGRSDSIREGIDDHLHSGSQLVFFLICLVDIRLIDNASTEGLHIFCSRICEAIGPV
jgi:hypothetical protein